MIIIKKVKGAGLAMLMILISHGLFCQESLKDGYNKLYYGNRQVSSEGMIKNGKPDGKWISYHINGKMKSEGNRRNFLLDSIWKFYDEQGNLVDEISYLDGKRSGYHIKYQIINKEDKPIAVPFFKELYLDNQKQGLSSYYNNKGELERMIRYKDGKKQGLTREFINGILQIVYKYHNDFLIDREFINQTDTKGMKQGVWREYFDNDNIKTEENYKNGVLNGFYREYNQAGKMLVSRFYENGTLVENNSDEEIIAEVKNQYDSLGNLVASGSYLNSIPVGTHRKYSADKAKVKIEEYDNSGQVVSAGVTNDKGIKEEFWQFFYPGGQVRLEGNYKNDKRSGTWKFYYPDGKTEQTGNYLNGLEDGLWTWYYANGSLRREENYLRGKEDGLSTEYDENGVIIAAGEFIDGLEEGPWLYQSGDNTEKGSYKAGLKDGIWKEFYPDGVLKFEGGFVQGSANGKHKLYYENGKIKEEQYYRMGQKDKTWWVFDPDGNVVISYVYMNDVLIKINGIRVNLETEARY
jgi:antitoxin component YwqK of YwqJK toxin-antitoxin module